MNEIHGQTPLSFLVTRKNLVNLYLLLSDRYDCFIVIVLLSGHDADKLRSDLLASVREVYLNKEQLIANIVNGYASKRWAFFSEIWSLSTLGYYCSY